MAKTVVFLVLTGEFMLFDDAFEVILRRHRANETVLFAAFHRLTINVEAVLLVEGDHAFCDELVQVFLGMRIDLRVIGVHGIREFKFCTGDA